MASVFATLPLPASREALASWITPLELTALAAIWGASFLFMRIAAPEFGALPLASVRLAFGALALAPFVWLARRELPVAIWPKLALIGALNSAIPFVLFAWTATRAPAGVSAIANSTTVLFTALVAFVAWREPIGLRRAVGLGLGFLGVVVLAGGDAGGGDVMRGATAGTVAALLYGVAANLVKRKLAGLPAVGIAGATLVASALMLAPFGVAQWPGAPISVRAWWCAIAIGVLCTGIAYALYFRLIRRVGPGRAVTVTYLVPLFAVAWAWLVLGEPLTWPMALAGALILGGISLAQSKAK
ncbi:MAG TPA: DMT family transporter [Candidatus Saccharimonadia bacterium]|nr:DMT family transporter [Candidatus Saccharimonadia bacterium]